MSSWNGQLYSDTLTHSLRCRSCSVTLTTIKSISCCKRSVSLCENCYTDDKCITCIMKNPLTGYTMNNDAAFIKISSINRYNPGDVVLFHPMVERGVNGFNTQLNLVHINKPKPYVLLHDECYKEFGRTKGDYCDLIIARLTSRINQMDQQVSEELCKLFGDSTSVYSVRAAPVNVKFERQKFEQ